MHSSEPQGNCGWYGVQDIKVIWFLHCVPRSDSKHLDGIRWGFFV